MAGLTDLLAHERWALRLARALLRDDDVADDVVQEARIAFWRMGPRDPDRAGGRFKARIKLNTTINQIVAHLKVDGDTRHVEVLSPTTIVVDKPHLTDVVIDLAPTDVAERDTY